MFAEVDVFISNYTLVDPEIYQLWVDGCSCKYKNESRISQLCRCWCRYCLPLIHIYGS